MSCTAQDNVKTSGGVYRGVFGGGKVGCFLILYEWLRGRGPGGRDLFASLYK